MVGVARLLRCRQVLLAVAVIAAVLASYPALVDAAPSNVQFSTSGFTIWNNRVSASWSDGSTYDCDGRYDGNYDDPHGAYEERTYTGGTFVNGARVSSGCTTRSVSTSGVNFGAGGRVRVGVRVRYDSGGRVRNTPTAYSSYRTLPERPNITSASVSGDILTVNWDSPTQTGSDLDWWIIGSTSSSLSDAFATVAVATDTPGARTGTLDLSSYSLTFGEPIHVWVAVSSTAPSTSQSHYLYWSRSYQVDTDTLEACTEADVEDLGYLSGYDYSVQGSFIDAPCEVDDKTAHAYKFRLDAQRDVNATFTPGVDYASGQGAYEVVVRTGALDGVVLKEGNGEGTFSVDAVQIAPNTDYYVTVIRSGVGGGDAWALALSYGYIAPPTPTPAPTPTPRIQPNLDFRLHPNPAGIGYTADETYSFEPEGPSFVFPLTVRSANAAALELSIRSSITCDITAADSVEVDDGDTLHVRACTAGKNTTLQVISDGGDLVGEYPVYVRGGPVPTPAAPVISLGVGEDVSKRDLIGLGIVVGVVCGGFGVGCDVDLVTNLIVTRRFGGSDGVPAPAVPGSGHQHGHRGCRRLRAGCSDAGAPVGGFPAVGRGHCSDRHPGRGRGCLRGQGPAGGVMNLMKRVLLSLVCAFFLPNLVLCWFPGCLVHGFPEQKEIRNEQ